jgi:hypothetical protein
MRLPFGLVEDVRSANSFHAKRLQLGPPVTYWRKQSANINSGRFAGKNPVYNMKNKQRREQRSLSGISPALRQRILETFSSACVVCGTSGEAIPLHFAHLVPVALDGETSEENVTAVSELEF